MQGTQSKTNATAVGGVIDLDALLTARALKPAQVKLMGEVYGVRRDLTAEEVVRYWQLIGQGEETEGLAMILLDGIDAVKKMAAALAPLPPEHTTPIYQRLMRVAGVLRRDPADEQDDEQDDEQGES